jgi:sortase (surface protein transpeptidase)
MWTPSHSRQRRGRRSSAAPAARLVVTIALATLAVLVSGCMAAPEAFREGAGSPPATERPSGEEQQRAGDRPPARPSADAAPIPSGARPQAVVIPKLKVAAPLIRLGLEPDRRMEVPEDYSVAGWYVGGPRPGEKGPAVIAGHVDSKRGPAVFYRLGELRRGDEVVVRYSGGFEVRFRVERTERHPKAAFPTSRVYGRTAGAKLRLITCGGDFNRASGHYRDNVIVFAVAVPS